MNVSGANTIHLNQTTTYVAAVSGTSNASVTWEVNGAVGGSPTNGTISVHGLYTAPLTMPQQNAISISAISRISASSVGTLSVTLLQPNPSIVSAKATSADGGNTVLVDVVGVNVAAGATLNIGGIASSTTAVSSAELQTQVSGQNLAGSSLLVAIVNPNPGTETSSTQKVAVTLVQASARSAARILEQATFGPTTAMLTQVEQQGLAAFLESQFQQPASLIPAIKAGVPVSQLPAYCQGYSSRCVDYNWLSFAMRGSDQLRQRVAFALSELFVVSENTEGGVAFPYYLNVLANDAFLNWSTIMHDVFLAPAMGSYLNMLNSGKAPAGQIANENFARECMQLFSLGINELNVDGTQVLDVNGAPIPNYTESQVQAFARAFTGWTYAYTDGSKPPQPFPYARQSWDTAMVAVATAHDTSSKILLDGVVLPSGQTAEDDLAGAIQNIFNDASLPPFICKQLLQHLVTSNPSPEYVARVSSVFINDGSGIRGNMKAVITAILLDPEARNGDTEAPSPTFGHLREPILWLSSVLRGLSFTALVSDPSAYGNVDWYAGLMSEPLHEAPSVFNYFPPDNMLTDAETLAPEFLLENTATVIEEKSLADLVSRNSGLGGLAVDLSSTSSLGTLASAGPQALIDALNTLFMHGAMPSQMNQVIFSAISNLKDPALMTRMAVYLVITSPEFKIYS